LSYIGLLCSESVVTLNLRFANARKPKAFMRLETRFVLQGSPTSCQSKVMRGEPAR
jgi:hypothetical protein